MKRLCDCTGYLLLLYQIETRALYLTFGGACRMLWGAVPVQGWWLYRYRADGCTGTRLVLYRYKGSFPANPKLGFGSFVGLVPVQGPVYRYKVADCEQFELQGAFCGRSPQVGTPEIAIATPARSCRIGRQNESPWGRLIPRVGMLTTTGPLLARRRPDYPRTYGGSGHVPGRLPLSPGA
uniref:Uncharacterized protein n=1 Tax=Ananas comosus var. bracteatus TaxID=296719 RepID=A0A6V7PQ27_ANACO|nr:unnamed protein product [Ananas comosus var. bracteatus]